MHECILYGHIERIRLHIKPALYWTAQKLLCDMTELAIKNTDAAAKPEVIKIVQLH